MFDPLIEKMRSMAGALLKKLITSQKRLIKFGFNVIDSYHFETALSYIRLDEQQLVEIKNILFLSSYVYRGVSKICERV